MRKLFVDRNNTPAHTRNHIRFASISVLLTSLITACAAPSSVVKPKEQIIQPTPKVEKPQEQPEKSRFLTADEEIKLLEEKNYDKLIRYYLEIAEDPLVAVSFRSRSYDMLALTYAIRADPKNKEKAIEDLKLAAEMIKKARFLVMPRKLTLIHDTATSTFISRIVQICGGFSYNWEGEKVFDGYGPYANLPVIIQTTAFLETNAYLGHENWSGEKGFPDYLLGVTVLLANLRPGYEDSFPIKFSNSRVLSCRLSMLPEHIETCIEEGFLQ
ncbi:hypothetical protein J4450_06620 [Candidatus Micrarchaeota archaeon]|nr:hypothetical protein [Candidatus Micrarchaeota archaeon]